MLMKLLDVIKVRDSDELFIADSKQPIEEVRRTEQRRLSALCIINHTLVMTTPVRYTHISLISYKLLMI